MNHIHLTCENHRNLRWHCKSIAVSDDGRYNGCRNIFYSGDVEADTYPPECDCPASALIAVNMADVKQARAEGN